MDEYTPPFNIEIEELGYWDSIDLVDDLLDALYVASSYCELFREEKIRIVDKNNKII